MTKRQKLILANLKVLRILKQTAPNKLMEQIITDKIVYLTKQY